MSLPSHLALGKLWQFNFGRIEWIYVNFMDVVYRWNIFNADASARPGWINRLHSMLAQQRLVYMYIVCTAILHVPYVSVLKDLNDIKSLDTMCGWVETRKLYSCPYYHYSNVVIRIVYKCNNLILWVIGLPILIKPYISFSHSKSNIISEWAKNSINNWWWSKKKELQ